MRCRIYFKRVTTAKDEEPDPDMRILEVMKANYGPVGETVMLRWKNGLFLPDAGAGTLDKLAASRKATTCSSNLLDRLTRQGRNVSDQPTANTYAPSRFSTEPEGKGRRRDLAAAMDRLFAANKIRVEKLRPTVPTGLEDRAVLKCVPHQEGPSLLAF